MKKNRIFQQLNSQQKINGNRMIHKDVTINISTEYEEIYETFLKSG